MTEQQYRVIADRAVIGDKVDFETWDAGDLLVYQYPGRGNHPGELVRIERPVPATGLPAPMPLTAAEQDSYTAAMGEPSLPTREQIAEAIAKAEDADYWVDEIRQWEAREDWEREAYAAEAYPVMAYEDRESFLRTADAVLALLQKGADRG